MGCADPLANFQFSALPAPPVQLKSFKYVGSQRQNAGIVIARDGERKGEEEEEAAAEADAQLAADEEFARQMQAKEDAKARQGRCAKHGGQGGLEDGGQTGTGAQRARCAVAGRLWRRE